MIQALILVNTDKTTKHLINNVNTMYYTNMYKYVKQIFLVTQITIFI